MLGALSPYRSIIAATTWLRNAVGAVASTLRAWVSWQPVSAFEFMTPEQIADVQSNAGTMDVAGPIANFIAHVTSNGKKGIFPAGTYSVGSTGWIGFAITSCSKFALEGHPGAVIKVRAQPTQEVSFSSSWKLLFKFVTCTDFDIKGLSFDGNNGLTVNFITMDQCSRAKITGNTFQHNVKSASGLAVQTFKGSGNIINGNIFQDVGNCIWAGFTDANFHEDRLTVCGNNAYDVDQDFIVGVMKNTSITGNVCKTLKKALVAMAGYDVQGTFSENVVIAGNYCSDTDGHPVQTDITGGIQAKNIAVVGNTFEDCGGFGVYLIRVLGATVVGNTIRKANGGITVEANSSIGSARVSITGNTIDATGIVPTQQGIFLNAENVANGLEDIAVTGNVVVGGYSVGISLTRAVTGTSRRTTITGNVVTGATNGIAVTGSSGDHTGVTLSGNTAVGNTSDMNVQVQDVVVGDNKYETTSDSSLENFTFPTDLDTTPSVKGGRRQYRHANSAATTITNFDDGVNGQEIYILAGNANTTIQHNANIRLNGSANFAMGQNNTLTLYRFSNIWFEKARGTAG